MFLAILLSDEETAKKLSPFLTPENISLLCKFSAKEEPERKELPEKKESQPELSEWLSRIMQVDP